jgi:mRNA-degrading endonuclease RelE of RelBE toxin-antitoxin system
VPKDVAKRTDEIQRELENDPTTPRGDTIKKLKGFERLWRYRIGDYRLIYAVDGLFVEYLAIGPRGSIYQRFNYNPDQPDESEAPMTEAGLFPESELAQRVRNDSEWVEYAARQRKQLEAAAESRSSLPVIMTPDLLVKWRIPEEYHTLLTPCRQRTEIDRLVDTGHLPMETGLLLIDLQYPKSAAEIAGEPIQMLFAENDLIRYVEGDITHFLLKLDPRQNELVDWALEGPTLVKGGPGSGKSTVAMYRIRSIFERAAANGGPPPHVLFTTYTNSLISATEELLPRVLEGLPGTFEISTVDKIAVHLAYGDSFHPQFAGSSEWKSAVKSARSEYAPSVGGMEGALLARRFAALSDSYLADEFAWVIEGRGLETVEECLTADRVGRGQAFTEKMRRIVWGLYEKTRSQLTAWKRIPWSQVHRLALSKAKNAPKKYDYIIIDEAQDLTPLQLRLCAALARDPRHIFLAADSSQSIYNPGFSFSRVDEALNVSRRTRLLKRNYRSTREIAEAAHELLTNDSGDPETLAQEHIHFGSKPVLAFAGSHDEQIHLIIDYIRRNTRYLRLPTGAAVILCPTNALAEQIARDCHNAGLSARYVKGDTLRLDDPFVKVLTIHSAKGLEFPIVAVPSVDEGVLPRASGATDPDDLAS